MAKTYSYVVLVEKKPVCRGKNLKKMLKEARRKYPKKKISIRYEYQEEILIAARSCSSHGKRLILPCPSYT
jgi:hypothetical protein